NKSYEDYINKLQLEKWDTIEELYQSKLQVFHLQAELQSKRAGSKRLKNSRQRKRAKRRKSF
ncbi:hypothetical protein COCC4DRAFT_155272, partial [Bipolaris maydis ATCC 48331]